MNFFNNLTSLQKSLVVSILSIVIFIATTGVTYSVFSASSKGSLSNSYTPTVSGGQSDDNEPKTEKCPLNGSLKSKTARSAWEPRRPLAVMIENHVDARPQSGVSSADIVYEAVAEGGITRFMAVFYCNSLQDIQVGPVRSARTYFLDWLSEYDALYAHVGGANTPGPADALSQIVNYGIKDLNQFSIGFPTYWRDYQRLGHEVATEHTMYSSTLKLWDVGNTRGWGATDSTGSKWSDKFAEWSFKDPTKPASGDSATKVAVQFWQNQPDYNVTWNFDQSVSLLFFIFS